MLKRTTNHSEKDHFLVPHLTDAFECHEAAPGALDLESGRGRLHHGLELDEPAPGGRRLLPDLLHEVEAQPALAGALVDLNERHRLVPRHGHVIGAHLVARIALESHQHALDEPLAFHERRLAGRRPVPKAGREERERRVHLVGRELELDERGADERRLVKVQSGQLVFQLDDAAEHGADHVTDVAPLLNVQHVAVARVELAAHHDVAQVDEAQAAEQHVTVLFRQRGRDLLLLVPK